MEFSNKRASKNANAYREINEKLEKSLPQDVYNKIRSSINALYQFSTELFPAFRCLVPVFLSDEWLALLNLRDDFYREHIVHQTQTAVVVQKLLEKLSFPADHDFVKALCTAQELRELGLDDKITLLDICALIMIYEKKKPAFIRNYATIIGLHNFFAKENFHLIKELIHVSAITAACYHDIGYAFRFAKSIMDPLANYSGFGATKCFQAEQLMADMPHALFMHWFTGIYDLDNSSAASLERDRIKETIQIACDSTHGLHSAYSFIYLNNYLNDKTVPKNPWAELALQWAGSAILMHDLMKVRNKICRQSWYPPDREYLSVSLCTDPVSFTVALADVLQCYDRYNAFVDAGLKHESFPLCFETPIQGLILRYDDESRNTAILSLHYIFYEKNSGRVRNTRMMHNMKFYQETIRDYFALDAYLDACGLFTIGKIEEEVPRNGN